VKKLIRVAIAACVVILTLGLTTRMLDLTVGAVEVNVPSIRADGCGAVRYTAGLALLAEGFAMRPYRLGMGVLVVLVACPVSPPPCHAQQSPVVPQGQGEHVFSVAFSPDGKMIAAGCGDGRIALWEVTSYKRRATLRGHTEEVTSVAFRRDGKLLASRGAEGTVRLWDLRTGKERGNPHGHGAKFWSVAFRADDKLVSNGKNLEPTADQRGKKVIHE
jgi:hypothetical protein